MAAAANSARLGFDPHRLERIQIWMERYIEAGKLPFAATMIARRGDIAWSGFTGLRDINAGLPYEPDTIVRIYSMSKPITSIGLMMLYERGLFHLDDPIEDFLPEFANLTVLREDAKSLDQIEPLAIKPTIHHLLTHTSGLTYGFQGGLLGEAYKKADVDFGPGGEGLAATTQCLSELPLQFQPGREWNYSVSSDVLGRLIEVISGHTLDRYLAEQIFTPLGMSDTGFVVPD